MGAIPYSSCCSVSFKKTGCHGASSLLRVTVVFYLQGISTRSHRSRRTTTEARPPDSATRNFHVHGAGTEPLWKVIESTPKPHNGQGERRGTRSQCPTPVSHFAAGKVCRTTRKTAPHLPCCWRRRRSGNLRVACQHYGAASVMAAGGGTLRHSEGGEERDGISEYSHHASFLTSLVPVLLRMRFRALAAAACTT